MEGKRAGKRVGKREEGNEAHWVRRILMVVCCMPVKCLPMRVLMFRACVVVSVAMVAASVPDLGMIIELFGAVCGTSLAILVPNCMSLIGA